MDLRSVQLGKFGTLAFFGMEPRFAGVTSTEQKVYFVVDFDGQEYSSGGWAQDALREVFEEERLLVGNNPNYHVWRSLVHRTIKLPIRDNPHFIENFLQATARKFLKALQRNHNEFFCNLDNFEDEVDEELEEERRRGSERAAAFCKAWPAHRDYLLKNQGTAKN